MPRLLVIEDEVDLLEMLQTLLTASGYDVVACASKDEAIAHLERNAFDLVLADLMVDARRDPDAAWRDVETLVELGRPAPVGIVTAWPVTQPRCDIAFVLAKPCSRQTLLKRIGETLHVEPLTDTRRQILRRYFESIQRGAYDALASIVTDDVVYQLPGKDPRFSQSIRGRDAFVAFTHETFRVFREPQFELSTMTALPNGASVEYVGSWQATEEVTARRSMPGAVLFEFRGEHIARIGIRVDPDRLQ